MMGRALRSWTIDPSIQAELIAYTLSNWNSSAQGNNVKADIVTRDHLPVFEALGYAEVSLGLDRFETYSAERLARRAAEWLHSAHTILARQNDPNDARPPSQIIDATAREQLLSLMQKVGLHERGDNNQIIDALVSSSVADEILDRLTGELLQLAGQGIKAISPQAWTERISNLLPAAADNYENDYGHMVREQAQQWVADLPDRTIAAVNSLITRFGLLTAARVVELVRDDLRAVSSELTDEAEEYRRWAQDYPSRRRSRTPAKREPWRGPSGCRERNTDGALDTWSLSGRGAPSSRRAAADDSNSPMASSNPSGGRSATPRATSTSSDSPVTGTTRRLFRTGRTAPYRIT